MSSSFDSAPSHSALIAVAVQDDQRFPLRYPAATLHCTAHLNENYPEVTLVVILYILQECLLRIGTLLGLFLHRSRGVTVSGNTGWI
jgi:hypothetical protein